MQPEIVTKSLLGAKSLQMKKILYIKWGVLFAWNFRVYLQYLWENTEGIVI